MNKKKWSWRTTVIFSIFFLLILFLGSIINRIGKESRHGPRELHFLQRNDWNLLLVSALLLIFIISIYLTFQITKQWEAKKTATIIQKLLETEEPLMTGQKKIDQELINIRNTIQKKEHLLEIESQRMKDLVIYLAHDLKTPLASVVGYLNLLLDIEDLPIEKQRKMTRITLDKAERLEILIEDFFEITRFGLHDAVLYKGSIDIVFLIRQMIDELYPLFRDKKQTILYDGPEQLLITIDGEKMARVLNNLLKNAVFYGDIHTDIIIHLSSQEDGITLTISNHGLTIPENQLERIFEKFYRLDQSRSSQTGGAGVGLTIAKEIVEAHQGHLFATSKDSVTVFTIELPYS